MKRLIAVVLFSVLFILFACDESNPERVVQQYSISGNAQKGPFINGSDVNIHELDSQFIPTGRTFYVNTDELGHFELPGVHLVSPYVQLVANGFYYNEVTGKLSNERLSLKAVSDLSDQSTVNINVLTNLEYERVMKLIKLEGKSVKDAKTQTQKEIFTIFYFDTLLVKNPESLDIINIGDADGALLAISAILQANRTTSELSKLQADIIMDLEEDGILNDTVIQTALISNATTLNLNAIKSNLLAKYDELGVPIENINNFELFVNIFKDNSDFHFSIPFDFPASTANGINLLALDRTAYNPHTDYAFAVNMPDVGKITIRITSLTGSDNWFYQPFVNYGWKVSGYNFDLHTQTFESTINGELIDVPLIFVDNESAKLEYFYNDSDRPIFTKTVTVGPN